MWLDSGNTQPCCWPLATSQVFVLPLRPWPWGTSALSHHSECRAVLKSASLGYMSSPSQSPTEAK